MPDTSRFLTALRRVIRSVPGVRAGGSAATDASARDRARSASPAVLDEETLPGQTGPDATVEVDPHRLRGVRLTYAPADDDEPDPGEVVWTWVPYAERDGRGKDRPVVVVAANRTGDFLAVELTSKPHDGDPDYVALGAGAWDSAGRPSWARVDRVFRVRTGGMRREASALDSARYAQLGRALQARYGWK
ncbi:type II toxin-antitoxin system PemK/MazF family toxin [Agromyces larvae]|uniref:Type II toxin-antitoxin system PemK/MazF family toxin n=1 Tax=Agromyces larvae TaxID=2929802 RepID=A0ABY4C1A5_9MICO|nr:type II toxin-antitoxin system PemK/MazF family toxin [Agromyces larvae]UOE45252.1 type II toxin-antitoxin system PemK/MazF family toxin [Agromyces larvae]